MNTIIKKRAHTSKLRYYFIFLLLSSVPNKSIADIDMVYLIQMRLDSLGYDVGEADGIMGPTTRRSMSDYMNKQNLEIESSSGSDDSDLIFSVYKNFRERSMAVREEVTEREFQYITPKIAMFLKDPDAAIFDKDSFYKLPAAYCGKVNGKNSYGAYNGFQELFASGIYYYFSGINKESGSITNIEFDELQVEYFCYLSW